MQRNIESLIGCSLEGTDGDIGEVHDFYFDDTTWTIRYLVIKTGNWLLHRKVLISPQAMVGRETESCILPVNLTKEQIKTSPYIDTDKPVSRQQDIELYDHYAWQRLGGSNFLAGGSAVVMEDFPIIYTIASTDAHPSNIGSDDDLNFRSTKKITGFHVHTSDGDFGNLTDFIFRDRNWQITYLVVDSHDWFGGKRFLIEKEAVKEIQWDNSKVILNISKDAIIGRSIFDESKLKHFLSVDHPSENSY